MQQIVSIIGRPNVGKSSLFNRLIGRKHAVISDIPGTTRDRIMEEVRINKDKTFFLVDTGGLSFNQNEIIDVEIKKQVENSLEETDLLLFVIDGKTPLTNLDYNIIKLLRKHDKKVVLVVNKCDNKTIENSQNEIYKTGITDIVFISVLHNTNLKVLLNKIESHLIFDKQNKELNPEEIEEEEKNIDLAFIGRPNVGKSSLLNAILNNKRVIVSEIAGTTRDSINTDFEFEDNKYTLIDTAGIRRRGKIEKGIEKYSILRTFKSITQSDVCVLLIDAEEGITAQDLHVISFILEQSKGLILAINKIDLYDDYDELVNRMTYTLRRKCSFVSWAPVVFISANSKQNIYEVLKLAKEIHAERRKRIQTSHLNNFLEKIKTMHHPSGSKTQIPKIYYISQVDINPPTFQISINKLERLHFSYKRYLENNLRKEYGFTGTAIKLKFQEKEKKSLGERLSIKHKKKKKS